MALSGAPGFGSGWDSAIGPIGGGSGDLIQGANQLANTSYSGSTTNTSIDAQGLEYLVNEILKGSQGLAATAEGKNAAGIYNSSTDQLLQNDLITQAAGYAASQNKTTTTKSSDTGSVISGIGGLFGGGGGGAAGGAMGLTVICTQLHNSGLMSQENYIYSSTHRPSDTMYRGYLIWAVPTVRLMRKYPRIQRIMKHIANGRVEQMQGRYSLSGCIALWALEPMSWVLGKLFPKFNKKAAINSLYA